MAVQSKPNERVERPDWFWDEEYPFGDPASTNDHRQEELRDYVDWLERQLQIGYEMIHDPRIKRNPHALIFDCAVPLEKREECGTPCVLIALGDVSYCGCLTRIHFEKYPSHKLEDFTKDISGTPQSQRSKKEGGL